MFSLLATLLGLFAASSIAAPHGDTESVARIALRTRGEVVLEVDADRVLQAIGSERPDGAPWTVPEVAEREAAILHYLAERYRLLRDDEPLALRPVRADPLLGLDPMFGIERVVRVSAHFAVEALPGDHTLCITQDLFLDLEGAHRHVVQFEDPDATAEPLSLVLTGRPTLFHLEDPSTAGTRARIAHQMRRGLQERAWILSALFVVSLAFAGVRGPPRSHVMRSGLVFALVAALASAIAHAIHLTPSNTAVQITLVASVVYLCGENLLARDLSLSTATSGLFGVVHGLALLLAWRRTVPMPRHDSELCTGAYVLGALIAPLALAIGVGALSRSKFAQQPRAVRIAANLLLAMAAVAWQWSPVRSR